MLQVCHSFDMYLLQHIVCMLCLTIYPLSSYPALTYDPGTAVYRNQDHFVKDLTGSLSKNNQNFLRRNKHIDWKKMKLYNTFPVVSFQSCSLQSAHRCSLPKKSVSLMGRSLLLLYTDGYGSDTERDKS